MKDPGIRDRSTFLSDASENYKPLVSLRGRGGAEGSEVGAF